MSLQICYSLMAACGLSAIIALMFLVDGDDSRDSSGIDWIAVCGFARYQRMP